MVFSTSNDSKRGFLNFVILSGRPGSGNRKTLISNRIGSLGSIFCPLLRVPQSGYRVHPTK